ncbi:uncharacterized protein STEHIDRAFT_154437 [Stereum hirsutum FP-91666 SS1]|uniref:uncharacterized protein n=1 Tax=Stereum hirsutum (strain FP-91666) TaxID=721885 RepID=UPI000440E3E4|nr:uncharacterized protein STEHIDRAFT_154437 [Stereum hirsutum FP-91666 SS1]EIM88712.1 hypothetical protein STEHIDRAFT_154437 [Stereum hirsutum FP-91666 SS1]
MAVSPASVIHGPAFIGIFLNLILYGAMIVQVFYYYTRYPQIYDVLVNNWGNEDALLVANWLFLTDPAITGIIAALVQSAIAAGILKEWTLFPKGTFILVLWLAGGAVADIGITIVITWHLRRHSANFTQQSDPLNRVVRMTISNGLITTLVNLADIIAFEASPSGLSFMFNMPLAKLYTNSALATLNQRQTTVQEPIASFKSPAAKLLAGSNPSGRNERQAPGVSVTVERHEMVDMPETDLKGNSEWELGHNKRNASIV